MEYWIAAAAWLIVIIQAHRNYLMTRPKRDETAEILKDVLAFLKRESD